MADHDQTAQEKHNTNLIYWEKMKELRNLTFYLHVIVGTLVCVEYPSIVEKELVKDHLLGFVHLFFYGIEGMYCYFVSSTALSLPSCGSLEYILVMVFNGVASQHYITFVNADRALYILLLWAITSGFVLIFTLQETWNQLYQIAATTIMRLRYIPVKIGEGYAYLDNNYNNNPQNQLQWNRDRDPQDIFNGNYFYFEKQKELRNITMWLHVICGTLVTVENPVIGIMDSLNFLHFIRPFFTSVQVLYLYYVLSISLSSPQSGTLEYLFVMVFNGLMSRFYIEFSDHKLATKVLKLWLISAGLLLLFTLEDTVNQICCIAKTGKDRLKNIWIMARDSPKNTRKWFLDH